MLDVTRLIWRRWEARCPTGIDRVCLAYLNRYADEAQAVVQHPRFRRILDRTTSRALFDLLRQPHAEFRRSMVLGGLKRGLRGGCEGRDRLYLNLGHTGLNDHGFRTWVRRAQVRPVYLVHDLIPITHPEFCRAGEKPKHEERMRTILSTAVGVIGNSQATLDDLARFTRREGLPYPAALAALLGSDAVTGLAVPRAAPTRPTFVVLGTIEGRKNHLLLLHIWSRIAARLGKRAPQLLVIGQRGWESEQVVDLLDRSATLEDWVTEIGRCDDLSLAAHLANARALLFPSLVEGYGLPLVEALRAGTPVIASDLPVFREIAGEVPDYLDPLDGPAWERAIISYAAQQSPARDAQLTRLKKYQAPTWTNHFASVDSWLSTL